MKPAKLIWEKPRFVKIETNDFYPRLMRDKDGDYILTREMVDEYFRKRGTYVKALHMPALNREVAAASTGGGKYKDFNSGPNPDGSYG